MKITQLFTYAVAVCAVSGCAVNVREQVTTAFEEAPEWFQARAEEVRGAGYPDVRDAPGPIELEASEDVWRAEVDAVAAAAAALEADPRAELPAQSDREDPVQWAAEMRARVAEGETTARRP